ncbi:hypothetical protein PIB30_107841, partial [Stylosanthes scabra]|nr:hypothetical protein [Stylosanthes scabra]
MRRTARICVEGKLNAQDIQNPHLCVSKHMRGCMGSSEDHESHAYAWNPTHMCGKQRKHATRRTQVLHAPSSFLCIRVACSTSIPSATRHQKEGYW